MTTEGQPIEREDRPEVFLEYTKSICPVCKVVIDAEVSVRDNKVILSKRCRDHGPFEALVYSDAEMYMEQLRFNKPGTLPLEFQTEVVDGCPLDCGLCPDHVRNMFFPWHAKAVSFVPWCTFSDPELAHAGLTGARARAKYGAEKVRVHELPLERSDRARTDAEEEGMLILVTAPERLVGAHALGPAAGELIHELAFAIRQKAKLHELSEHVHVYPTRSTSIVMMAAEAAYERAQRFAWLIRG